MTLVNQAFYDSLNAKIDTLSSKEEAEKFISQAFEPIKKQLDSMMSQIYAPLEEQLGAYIGEANILLTLLNPPQDPLAIIPWVNGVVSSFTARLNLIKVQIKPPLLQYSAMEEVLSVIPNEIARLRSNLQTKSDEKEWGLTIPDIPIPSLPPLPPIPPILTS